MLSTLEYLLTLRMLGDVWPTCAHGIRASCADSITRAGGYRARTMALDALARARAYIARDAALARATPPASYVYLATLRDAIARKVA